MKFRLKLALSMLCLMSLLLGASGSFLISVSFSNGLDREQKNAYSAYQSVLGILQLVCSVKQPSDYDGISEVLEQFPVQGANWAALKLYHTNGIIYQDGTFPVSDPSKKPERDLSHVPEICTISYLDAGNMHYLAVTGILYVSGEELYLDILYDVTSVFETRITQLKVYGWVFLLFVILCAFLSFALSYALTRPLTKLSAVSQEIASGKLSRRAQISTDDEIGQVARDFNVMADTLEHNITELENSVERQKRFTSSFAHEVKTPMTSIIGYADLIRGGTLNDEEQRQAANFIFTEGRRLERLSQKLQAIRLII